MSRRTPQPPRNRPGPPESRISSKRSITRGWFASCASTGMFEALNAHAIASHPSFVARAPVPDSTSSYATKRRFRARSQPPNVGFAMCEAAAATRAGTARASAPTTASNVR